MKKYIVILVLFIGFSDNSFSAKKTAESLEEQIVMAALDAAKNDFYLQATEAILALGYEKELIQSDNDLAKFEEKYPEFKALLGGSALLSISENLSLLDRIEGSFSQFFEKHAGWKSYSSAVATAAALGALKAGLAHAQYFYSDKLALFLLTASDGVQKYLSWEILIASGEFAAVAAVIASVFIGGYYSAQFLSKNLWGNQIRFTNVVAETEFENSSGRIYCQNLKNSKQSFWLNSNEGHLVSGSWGQDPETQMKGFAVQETPIRLIARCASQMRMQFSLNKIAPSDIAPAVGVPFANSNILYATFPLIYYSKFADAKGNAVKLSHYFSNKGNKTN